MFDRRDFLRTASAGLGAWKIGRAEAADRNKRLLVYTRSAGYEHSVVKVDGGKPSLVDTVMTRLAGKVGIDVECTKDGRVFMPDTIGRFDAFFFMTTEDLTSEKSTDGAPPMPKEGKQALLDAIAAGKGFIGSHCAADTFHSAGRRRRAQEPKDTDPYIRMLGGEFIGHGPIQDARTRVIDAKFPGIGGAGDFILNEEWYSLKNFADDLHVILATETAGMNGIDYQRPAFPATWARMHGKGRVFYTSMGHKEEVWQKTPLFLSLLTGALRWVTGMVDADVTPNLATATAQARSMPPEDKPQPKK